MIFGESGGAERIALLHGLGVLRGGELVAVRLTLNAGAGGMPQRVRGSQRIRVESDAVGDPASAGASVAEVNRHGFIGVPWKHPHRALNLSTGRLNLDDIAGGDAVMLRALGRDPHGVVPGHFVLRLGHFLKPGVVRHGPVAHCGIGTKHNFEPGGRGGGRFGDFRGRSRFFGQRSSGDDAVVQRDLPEIVEVGAFMLS